MRKQLFPILILNLALLAIVSMYISISIFTGGANEEVEEILESFKVRSKICTQPLPTLDSYIARYSTEKVAKWLWDYVQLHREIMCAEQPSVPRRYVVYHASAGLANRMQSLFSTFIFAVLSDRALVVDWRPQPKSHTCFVHDLFDPPDVEWSYQLLGPLLDDTLIDEHSLRLAFDDPLLLDPFLCANVSAHYRHVPVIDIHTDEYFVPLFERGYYRDTLRDIFEDREIFTEVAPFLFRVTTEIQSQIDNFEQSAFGPAGCALGLQVRATGIGDNSTTPHSLHNGTGSSARIVHWECAREVLAEQPSTAGKIFLASDVQKIRDQAASVFGDRVVVYPMPVRAQENQTCSEVKAALIDLMLLSRCRSMVVTSWSSLGSVAHSLSGVKPMIALYKAPAAHHISSIKASEGHPRNYCHQVEWSRPCYLEWVHARHLSCFNRDMFEQEPCCELGFCEDCLHHEPLASSFLTWYHWPTSKVLLTALAIGLISYGTYRALLYHFIRRNNYRLFARNISLGVLLLLCLIWLLLVTIVRSEYHRNIVDKYIITW